MGTAVVKRPSVRSPGGVDLQFSGVVLQIGHLTLVYVIGDEVALRVIHLNLIGVGSMKALQRLVGRINDQFQPGMPGGIDTSGKDRIIAHIHLLHLAVVSDEGTTMFLTGMKLHTIRIILLIMVTVDALTFTLKATEHVVIDYPLIIVLQTALADSQRLIAHKRRMNKPVADPAIDTVG